MAREGIGAAGHKHGCCADRVCNDRTCMELPAGKTCGDCVHLPHCAAFVDRKGPETSCDWFPRLFREPVAKPITSLTEFCAEAGRIGLPAADLADPLRDQPEFADCATTAGVSETSDEAQQARNKDKA